MARNKPGWKMVVIAVTVLVGTALLASSLPALAESTPPVAGCQGPGLGRAGGSLADVVCDVLNISRQDLAQERQKGKSLLDIAKARNVNQDQIVNAAVEKRQELLRQALQEQKITQEQYGQCIQKMKASIEQNLARTQTGPNRPGMGNGWKAGKGQYRGSNTGPDNGTGMCRGGGYCCR